MIYRSLGKSGLQVSALSLGSWRTFGQEIDDQASEACMRAAYEGGVNFFDGAEGYGQGAAERTMGKVFRATGWDRTTLIISSKVFHGGGKPTQVGLSRKHVVEACDAALQRMGLDYLDLYFCHRPDPKTSAEEVVHTMNELIQRGKIFYWGTSEFSAPEVAALFEVAERDHLVGPVAEQTGYSMLRRDRLEDELLSLIKDKGLGTTIYSPLAFGILSGKYHHGIPEDSAVAKGVAKGGDWMKEALTEDALKKSRGIGDIAAEMGVTQSQLALAWCLKNPHVSTAITGASRPSQVTENLGALDVLKQLSDERMERIAGILGKV